ncbi:hypothetical protein FO519_000085 [Halicephalobus sp. NKZ332]|nr:hypothetical protein FO519_000085 [Halicephalobus sp. NKZ332]
MKMINYFDAEETDEEKSEKESEIFALSMNPNVSKLAEDANSRNFPTQHVKLFLPFFIEEIRSNDVYNHPRFFGLSKEAARKFGEILDIEDESIRCQIVFTYLADLLNENKIANEFACWFLENGKNEEMKNLFLFKRIEQGALAVYEHYILGIGNGKTHKDNVDRITGLLFLDEIINYLVYYSCDRSYVVIGNEVREIWEKKTQFSRWCARSLLIVRMMHANSNKKKPEFWFNEFLVACDRHPRTRPIAFYLEPDYKETNVKYLAHLKAMSLPAKMSLEFVDESYSITKPRPQSDFGSRPDSVNGLVALPYSLRGYQEELSRKAKNGQNTIVCAPTGSGKTHVAIDVIANHLRQKRQQNQTARVVVFVPTIPLVEQQHQRIYNCIGTEFYVTKMSGAEKAVSNQNNQAEKILIGDICVMTPQIFVNMLLTPLKKQKIYIGDFTLMIFDECHHCAQQHPYNVVMANVRKTSLKPQIVGLTASVGTGNVRGVRRLDIDESLRHITGLCARLNASTISSVGNEKNMEELRRFVSDPIDEFIPVRPSVEDRFAHELALFMDKIHKKMIPFLEKLSLEEPLIKEKMMLPMEEKSRIMNGSVKTGSHFTNGLAVLRDLVERKTKKQGQILVLKMIKLIQKCYSTLKMNELFPARLALEYLEEEFYDFDTLECSGESRLSNEELRSLESVLNDTKEILKELRNLTTYSENKEILNKLFELIKDQYRNSPDSRILIFVTLRKTAPQLKEYIGNHPDVVGTFGRKKVGYITSSNQSSMKYGQSREEQNKTLERFREGLINILIATSVAEEGIDVASCNLVIKYNSIGNEKSFVQRKGRARDMKSKSVLLALDYDVEQKEYVNMMKAYQMNLCINILQSMTENELKDKIMKQKMEMEREEKENRERARLFAEQLRTIYILTCENCGTKICNSTDLRLLNSNHVIICFPECWKGTFVKPKVNSKLKRTFESNVETFCGDWYCQCGRIRGELIKFGEVFFPTLAKDAFRLKNLEGNYKNMNQKITWKMITEQYFTIPPVESSDIRDMASSLDAYEEIYRSAVRIELENLNMMARRDVSFRRPILEIM